MALTRAVFLVNPASANGSTGRRWPEIAHRAAAAGLSGDSLLSSARGELTVRARRGVGGGGELLVVVGGDGSVSEVVNGMAGSEGVAIAVIPRGTGWDFARSLGIPRNVDRAIGAALTGETRTIDLGRATYRLWSGGEGQTWFANVASAGMSGAIAQRANDTTKALGGKISYLWATFAVFARWSNTEVQVSVDGETRRGRMHDVIVSNGPYIGGGMKICPDADLEDGAFDVLLIGDLLTEGPERAHHPVCAGSATESLDRLLAGVGESFHDVLLSRPGHGPIVPVAMDERRAYAPRVKALAASAAALAALLTCITASTGEAKRAPLTLRVMTRNL